MFKIDCEALKWISEIPNDPQDLCLHGKVRAIIGDEILEDDATVSSTALYLLKTLTQNHIAGEDNQMLPCCGHTLIYNEDLTEVQIIGCPYGTDWTVEQVSGGVKITTESGRETIVPMNAYREEVFRFADKVEDFYLKSPAKKPYDEFARKGYTAFWNEWHRRRGE